MSGNGDASMFLNAEELEELTNLKRPKSQIRALRSMGIEHMVRIDGRPLVLRAFIEKKGMGEASSGSKKKNSVQPNWKALA